MDLDSVTATLAEGYRCDGVALCLGAALYQGQVLPAAPISLPLKMFNRHGLVAGATGTGKTKTLQVLAEQCSEHGIPSLLMDLKGDLSGLAAVGQANPGIAARHKALAMPFVPRSYTVELLRLVEESEGVPLRATISEYGPLLFAQMLGLNRTQSSVVSMLFKYSRDHHLPLLDLKDFKQLLTFASGAGKPEMTKHYGHISTSSLAAILRNVIELEEQGAANFFAEPSFDVKDLLRTNEAGEGVIHLLGLQNMQTKPQLFCSFMLSLLAEVYQSFPEVGDLDKPKLLLFIDEAHLIFEKASEPLLEYIAQVVKLIRSKGVGLIFCTQQPDDIPAVILGQLGLKIQHALRAFTANDRKAIKLAARNYPLSDLYDPERLLTSLGIGEALVTGLNEAGQPTPLCAVRLRAPHSRMGALSAQERAAILQQSHLLTKYEKVMDRESAFELLQERLQKKAPPAGMTQDELDAEPKKGASEQAASSETESGGFWAWMNRNTLFKTLIVMAFRQVIQALLQRLKRGQKVGKRQGSMNRKK